MLPNQLKLKFGLRKFAEEGEELLKDDGGVREVLI